MSLELHRRDEAHDAEVRLVKVMPRWLTADQYDEIPRTEAAAHSRLLADGLPPETLRELARLLTDHLARA